MGRHTLFAILAVVVLTLSGCLSAETSVELERDGSGRITLNYIIDARAFQTGAVGGEDAGRIVPVTRRDFERAAAELEGLHLRRYRSRENEESVEVTAELDFENVLVLRRFLGPDTLEVELTAEGGRWTQIIAAARVPDEGDSALAESLSGYSLSFLLEPPSAVSSVSAGEITPNGRAAGLTVGFDEVVMTPEPIVWTVEW